MQICDNEGGMHFTSFSSVGTVLQYINHLLCVGKISNVGGARCQHFISL